MKPPCFCALSDLTGFMTRQTVVSRNIDPTQTAVVTIGTVSAG